MSDSDIKRVRVTQPISAELSTLARSLKPKFITNFGQSQINLIGGEYPPAGSKVIAANAGGRGLSATGGGSAGYNVTLTSSTMLLVVNVTPTAYLGNYGCVVESTPDPNTNYTLAPFFLFSYLNAAGSAASSTEWNFTSYGGGPSYAAVGFPAPSADRAHTIVIAVDKTISGVGSIIDIYVDGTLQTLTTGIASYSVTSVNTTTLYLGKRGASTLPADAIINFTGVFDNLATPNLRKALSANPWQLFAPDYRNSYVYTKAATVTTHTTTGVLTGQGSTVAGTAAHIAIHTTTGALTGQGSTVAGSATRFRAFSTSGVLTGQGSVIVGSAVHNVPHATSGVLTGQGSTIVGAADHQVPGAVTHATTGVLTGQGSTVAGSATRFRAFDTSGALTGQGSTIVGTSAHIAVHTTTGVLPGQTALINGVASRVLVHDATGILTGQGAVINGVASRPSGKIGGDDAPRGIYWQNQPQKKITKSQLSTIIDNSIAEFYDKTIKEAPKSVVKKVAAIVKPFASGPQKIPSVNKIDWESLQNDIQAIKSLMALVRPYNDDNEILAIVKQVIDSENQLILSEIKKVQAYINGQRI